MLRRLVAVLSLALVLAMAVQIGPSPAPKAQAADPPFAADSCLDPHHRVPQNTSGNGNAVSVWQWIGSNSLGGNMTIVQSNTGDSSTAGTQLSDTLDALAIHGLFDIDWVGTSMRLGSDPSKPATIFVIANTKPAGLAGFMFAVIKTNTTSGTPQFKGFALGEATGFASYTSTLKKDSLGNLACYTNLISNPAFEVPNHSGNNDLNYPAGWCDDTVSFSFPFPSTCGGTSSLAEWLREVNPGPAVDHNTGKNSLEVQTTYGSCPDTKDQEDPGVGVWVSDLIPVSGNNTWVFGGFMRSVSASAPDAYITLEFYSTILFDFKVGETSLHRHLTNWGYQSQIVQIDSSSGVNRVRLVLHTDGCVANSTVTSHFDDIFLINAGSNTELP